MKHTNDLLDYLYGRVSAFLTSMEYRSSLGFTFLFSMLANAFAYFNISPQHDSVNHMFEFAGTWELSLGRFLLPLYGKLQGQITTPWLIGVMSIFFISLIVRIVCDLLDLKKTWQIGLVAGILSANLCVTELACVFTWVLPVYMLSALFAALGVYCLRNGNSVLRYPAAVILFVTSMGLYQAEIAFGIALLAILAIQDLMDSQKNGRVILHYIKAALALIFSSAAYYILYHLVLRLSGIEAADSYNSLSNISDITLPDLVASVGRIYGFFFRFLFGEGCFVGANVTRSCNILLTVLSLASLAAYLIRKGIRPLSQILILLLLLALPGLICLLDIFMSSSRLSFYLLYSYNLYYIFLLFLLVRCGGALLSNVKRILTIIAAVCLCLILLQNIRFSNQIYSYQKILYDRTLSVATRILDRVESEEEYQIGETEVIVIGSLRTNEDLLKTLRINESLDKNLQNNMDLRNLMERYGFNGGKALSVTYNQTFDSFAYLLGSELNLVSDSSVINEYSAMEKVRSMPTYPRVGYCEMIDGRMVIKLS